MSSNAADLIGTLQMEIIRLCNENRLDEAIPIARELLTVVQRKHGKHSLDFATASKNLAVLYQETAKYGKAEPLFYAVLQIRRSLLGEAHPLVGDSFRDIASFLNLRKDYRLAEQLLSQALSVYRQTLKASDERLVEAEQEMDELHLVLGIPVNRRSCTQPQEAHLAPPAEDVIRHQRDAEHYEELLPLVEEEEAHTRELAGDTSLEYAKALEKRADLYVELGRLDEAKGLYQWVLQLKSWNLDSRDKLVVQTQTALAQVAQSLSNWHGSGFAGLPVSTHALVEVERIYSEAVSMHEKQQLDSAMALAQRALGFAQESLGAQHQYCAWILRLLGVLHQEIDNAAEAERFYMRALTITEATLGRNHEDFRTILIDLAGLYADLEMDESVRAVARELHKRFYENADNWNRVTPTQDRLGTSHGPSPDLVRKFERHAANCTPSIADKTSRLISDFPLYARSSRMLESLHKSMESPGKAFDLVNRALSIDGDKFKWLAALSSDEMRVEFLQDLRSDVCILLSILINCLSQSQEHVEHAFNVVLRLKNLSGDIVGSKRDMAFAEEDNDLRSSWDRLTELRREIARLSLSGPRSEEERMNHVFEMTGLRRDAEMLEGRLESTIPRLTLNDNLRRYNYASLATSLPSGSALIQLIRADMLDFSAMVTRPQALWKPAHYLAFVVSNQTVGPSIALVDLGECYHIDLLTSHFIPSVAGRHTLAAYESSGVKLRKAVFDPLVKSLGKAKRLLISLDSHLSRLPFEILPTDKTNSFLVDEFSISYLTSGRELIEKRAGPADRAGVSVVIANPDFCLSLDNKEGSHEMDSTYNPVNSANVQDIPGGRLVFTPLPESEKEAEEVARRIPFAQKWVGAKVVEHDVKRIRSPHILHIATHGFIRSNCLDNLQVGRRTLIDPEPNDGFHFFTGGGIGDPMLSSGLALAGAQTWLEGGELPREAEDGLLMGIDIVGMDLRGTDLVVLSCCDSGRGEIKTGDAVFGLPRAFQVAGARSLLVALWEVDDLVTREFMIAFYDEISNKETKADALDTARKVIRKKYYHPYYWGAFVLFGHQGAMHAN